MKFMSMDQSSGKFALAIFEDEKLIDYKYYDLIFYLGKDSPIEQRISATKELMLRAIKEYNVEMVVLEDIFLRTTKFSPYAGYNSFKTLAKLLGVLENALYELEILSMPVKASVWRATCKIKGKGGVQKDNAVKFVVDKFGLSDTIEVDTAEAICLGWHTAKKIIPKVRKK
jgi:Holliday junction resolvasome RuvABC endonuclease subunit